MLFSAGTFLYVATVHVLPETINLNHSSSTNADGTEGHEHSKRTDLIFLVLGIISPLILTATHHHHWHFFEDVMGNHLGNWVWGLSINYLKYILANMYKKKICIDPFNKYRIRINFHPIKFFSICLLNSFQLRLQS